MKSGSPWCPQHWPAQGGLTPWLCPISQRPALCRPKNVPCRARLTQQKPPHSQNCLVSCGTSHTFHRQPEKAAVSLVLTRLSRQSSHILPEPDLCSYFPACGHQHPSQVSWGSPSWLWSRSFLQSELESVGHACLLPQSHPCFCSSPISKCFCFCFGFFFFFWLCWVFLRHSGSFLWPAVIFQLWLTDAEACPLAVAVRGLSCSTAREILVPWPGTEPTSLHWKQLLSH